MNMREKGRCGSCDGIGGDDATPIDEYSVCCADCAYEG
jgi:hypothetical protein